MFDTIEELYDSVGANLYNFNSCTIQFTGEWQGAITFQGTVDGINWFTTSAFLIFNSPFNKICET